MNANIAALFHQAYLPYVDRDSFVCPGEMVISYGDLNELSEKMATALSNRGLASGDRLMAQADKSIAFIALYLATLRLGAVFVPVNTAYTSRELALLLEDAEPAIVVCCPERLPSLTPLVSKYGIRQLVSLGVQPDDKGLWQEAQRSTGNPTIAYRHGDDLAALLYTSGTTGQPKGAMITHNNLTHNIKALAALWRFSSDDTLIHALPMFHVHGLFVALHCVLFSACSMIILRKFEVKPVLQCIRSKATVMMGVPTYYERLLNDADCTAELCRSMRLFISGSAAMSPQTHRRWERATGHPLLERYGMTEAGIITSNSYDSRLPGSVGHTLPGVSLRICDGDGNPLPAGVVGGIEIKGPSLFKGYWNRPQQNQQSFRDNGFFITQDLGILDEHNRLSIIGRLKDLVISGGYNIYPKEIEMVIGDFPGVAEVAAIGVPHPDYGEALIAVIVERGDSQVDEAELTVFLRRNLAAFKLPKRIIKSAELPKNHIGKVQKLVLRKRYSRCLSGNTEA